jgi:hypothetical protein
VHEKYWDDRHIKKNKFHKGDLVFLYDKKFSQHLGKFHMHWLGPYVIIFVIDTSVV